MDKWPNRNWCCLLIQFLYIFIATSCSTIKMPSFIIKKANDQNQNNIESFFIPTTDNQVSLLKNNSKEKDKEITELRTILNNLNELKIKIENKNNQVSLLKKELGRITSLNNYHINQISRLKSELDQATKSRNFQEKEITRLKKKLDRTTNLKQIKENEITHLKNKLDQIIKLEQTQALEEIEESNFFEP